MRTIGFHPQEMKEALQLVADDMGCGHALFISDRQEAAATQLEEHIASDIFLIAREALINACKHAGASRITVLLNYTAAPFMLECNDNGKGFDKERRDNLSESRFGLQGMEERAASIGALLFVESTPENGTRVKLTLNASSAHSH